MLQRIFPLFFLMPSYSYRLLDLEGHSITRRFSLSGALTLTQSVTRAKSFPSCLEIAYFQSSFSPLYLRVWLSHET